MDRFRECKATVLEPARRFRIRRHKRAVALRIRFVDLDLYRMILCVALKGSLWSRS